MRQSISSIQQRLRATACLIAALVVVPFSLIPNSLYQGLENIAYDYLQGALPKIDHETRILLIDVDEKSLAEIGAWPWPRNTTAKLISNLTEHYQVALLGMDMIFPDRRLHDEQLQKALSHPAITLAQTYDFNPDSQNQVGMLLSDAIPSNLPASIRTQAYGYIANHSGVLPPHPINSATWNVGHITPKLDDDGKVRKLNPIICVLNSCTLALSTRLLFSLYQPEFLLPTKSGIQFLPYGPNLPLDAQNGLWIPYLVNPGGFEYISAADVLLKRIPVEKLNNTITLLGSTALSLGDRVSTPQGNQTPGIEIHAQILSAGLDNRLITPYEIQAVPVNFIALLILILLAVCIIKLPAKNAGTVLVFSVVMSGIYISSAYLLLRNFQITIPAIAIPLFLILASSLYVITEGFRSNRKLSRIAIQSSYFLPAMLVNKLLNEQEVIAGTEKKQLTVLVTDMRGFTHASEGKVPERVALLAQKCLETLASIVVKHGGIIEKYTGDGLMAIWGAHGELHLHAQHALNAALEMQTAIVQLEPWFIEHGFDPMKVSIGINSGEMAVGIFGNAHRAWSAHGDAVNLATRIEQLTRTVGKDLLLGQLTAQLIGLDRFECCGSHLVKGRDEAVAVYALKPAG
ncbi:MAG: hypothetical protein RIR18_735 [Pseudomonadota bacterium]